MVDGLEKQPLLVREDRADGVDELGEIRELDGAALPDEAVEVGGHGQGIREIELLLDAAHAILVLPLAIPDIPFVEGDVNGMRDALGMTHSLEEGAAQAHRSLPLMGREHVGVVIGLPRVEVDAVVIDHGGQSLNHRHIPVAHPVVTTADQLDGGIRALHHQREGLCLLDVVLGTQAADLPAAVHLVAEPPVAHAVGLGMAMLAPQVRPRRIADAVAVFHPRLRLVHGARAHVDADVRLGAHGAAILDELVGAEPIRLLRVPGELAPARPIIERPHTVEPVVSADEVAAGPSQDGYAQRSYHVEHVTPESALVTERRSLIENAAIDAAADMLDEVPKDPPVHRPDLPLQVDPNRGHGPGV